MVFPHVGDEFSVDRTFLESVFEMESGPTLTRGDGFFTIGSCFARNIAQHLAVNGHQAKTFGLAEDLNSPISNAFLLQMMHRTPGEQLEILLHWINTIFPELADAEKSAIAAQKQREIAELHGNLKAAGCVILTLGNVVDFFRDDGTHGKPLMDNIFPKFIAMPGSEDINVRSASAANLKGKGAVLRLATYSETLEAIKACVGGIRSVTDATLVVTISPVPIDSVIGLATHHLKSAIEVDCVSKSRIRSAFDEVFAAERAHGFRDLVFSVLRDRALDRAVVADPGFRHGRRRLAACVVSGSRRRVLAVHAEVHHLFRPTCQQARGHRRAQPRT